MIAEVIISSSAKRLNRTFDYNIPDELQDFIFVGSKVLVPFGRFKTLEEAHVVKIKNKSEYEVKDIAKVEDSINDEQIQLAKWMAKKYFCNVSDCIKLMQTPGTKSKNRENRIQEKSINVVRLKREWNEIQENIHNKKIKSEKQIKILNFVYKNPESTIPEIEAFTNCSRGIVNTLIKNDYLEIDLKKINRNPLIEKNIKHTSSLVFNNEQQSAFEKILESINNGEYKEFLLHGITGSGKTEVYLQLINEVVKKGKKAIVLVPEISLTPQIIDRFISRFGKEEIAILHSKLSLGERHDEWERIKNNKAKIIIGARSAIFAPVKNLGIIIIDEEHDSSYKSETNPRYNAKEVAEEIAKREKIPLLLGSATPDVKDYYYACDDNMELLEITKRANNSVLPKVEIVDLKQELANGNRSMLSFELYNSIEKCLKEKTQVILFLNRRGFSSFVMCRDCGYTVNCKNCNVSMTFHSFENKLKCHYCGYEEKISNKCPNCGSHKIKYFGTGTQKLEEEIKKYFPMAKVLRMDNDTVKKKNSYEEILNTFKNEDIDILIGTQMVSKGHHFPRVKLVGVIAADSLLGVDDYRASERTFQMLTQVAGRAGREKIEGKVIIQTYNPENYSIQNARKHNYYNFYETEIAIRKQLKYPPFCDIIVIGFNSTKQEEILTASNNAYNYLIQNLDSDNYLVFKPMPCPIDKIQNKLRWRIIIKGKINNNANEILNDMLQELYRSNYLNTKISIDVNPNNMV